MSSVVKIQKRRAFSAIPDDILQDTRMRTETRLVLGWLIGRPDGWEVRIGHVQRTLGLTRPRWVKARKEMEAYGYLLQTKRRDANGHFVWEHIVTDTPNIPKATTVPKSNDGKSTDGKSHDITTQPNPNYLNTPLTPPVAITQACYEEARKNFPGYDIDSFEKTWAEWVSGKDVKPTNPDRAFLGWVRTYTQKHPLPFDAKL